MLLIHNDMHVCATQCSANVQSTCTVMHCEPGDPAWLAYFVTPPRRAAKLPPVLNSGNVGGSIHIPSSFQTSPHTRLTKNCGLLEILCYTRKTD